MKRSIVSAISEAIVRQMLASASGTGAFLSASRRSRLGRRRPPPGRPRRGAAQIDEALLEQLASALTERLNGQAQASHELPLEPVEI